MTNIYICYLCMQQSHVPRFAATSKHGMLLDYIFILERNNVLGFLGAVSVFGGVLERLIRARTLCLPGHDQIPFTGSAGCRSLILSCKRTRHDIAARLSAQNQAALPIPHAH